MKAVLILVFILVSLFYFHTSLGELDVKFFVGVFSMLVAINLAYICGTEFREEN